MQFHSGLIKPLETEGCGKHTLERQIHPCSFFISTKHPRSCHTPCTARRHKRTYVAYLHSQALHPPVNVSDMQTPCAAQSRSDSSHCCPCCGPALDVKGKVYGLCRDRGFKEDIGPVPKPDEVRENSSHHFNGV